MPPYEGETRAGYLEFLVRHFELPDFIDDDPISIPHGFDDPRDQEIIGLYAALLAWGRRDTLLKNLAWLCEIMHFAPHQFVSRFSQKKAALLSNFKHRTFQPIDAVWFTLCLQAALLQYGSLENYFSSYLGPNDQHVGPAIEGFSASLLDRVPDCPVRLQKHLARPSNGSACKRLSMFLRWMVRPGPVDLGIWPSIRPAQLVLPLDVHSGRTARALGLLDRRANDWQAVLELTEQCRLLSPDDPARYDFAFFGTGISGLPIDPRFDVLS